MGGLHLIFGKRWKEFHTKAMLLRFQLGVFYRETYKFLKNGITVKIM